MGRHVHALEHETTLNKSIVVTLSLPCHLLPYDTVRTKRLIHCHKCEDYPFYNAQLCASCAILLPTNLVTGTNNFY